MENVAGEQTGKKWMSSTKVFVVLMFLTSVIIRTVIASRYPIHLETYPDELRYYRIATGMANGTGLSLYNAPYDYQKILYALLIAPACLIQSMHTRIICIFFINSFVMSAGVFPMYYLSAKLIENRLWRMGLCLVYLIGGHMTYTMSFMSENLWIPLALFLLCVFCNIFEYQDGVGHKKVLWLNIGAGILTYLAYLCKEIALIFPLAYIAFFMIWESCASRTRTRKRVLRNIQQLVVYFTSFIVPFIMLKLTVFYAMGNSYNQQGLSALIGEDKIYYLLYGMVYYVMNVLTMSFCFPVLLSCMHMNKLRPVPRKLCIFVICLILIAAFVVSYTISLREDYPSVNPRAHMRYIAWVMPVFITLFAHLLEVEDHKSVKKSYAPNAAITFGLGIFYIVFYRGPYMTSHVVDTTMFLYYGKTGNQVLLINIVLVAVSIVLARFLYNKRMVMILSIVLILGTQIYDTIRAIEFQNKNYVVSEAMYSEVMALKDIIKNNPQSCFLIIDDFLTLEQRTLDTYLTEKNVYITSYSGLAEAGHDLGNLSLGKINIPIIWYEVGAYNAMDVNYIIVRNTWQAVESNNCEEVPFIESDKYSIYKLTDSCEPIAIVLRSSDSIAANGAE